MMNLLDYTPYAYRAIVAIAAGHNDGQIRRNFLNALIARWGGLDGEPPEPQKITSTIKWWADRYDGRSANQFYMIESKIMQAANFCRSRGIMPQMLPDL